MKTLKTLLVVLLFLTMIGFIAYQQTRIRQLQVELDGFSALLVPDNAQLGQRLSNLEESVNRLYEYTLEPSSSSAVVQTSVAALPAVSPTGTTTFPYEDADGDKERLVQRIAEKRLDAREEREESRDAKDAAREEKHEDRVERKIEEGDAGLEKFIKDAALTEVQARDVTALIHTEREQAQAILNAAREGERNLREARKGIKAVREVTDTAVRALLDDAQFAAFQQLRKDLRGFPPKSRDGQ